MSYKRGLLTLLMGSVLSLAGLNLSLAEDQRGLTRFVAGTPPSFSSPFLALDSLKTMLASNDVDGVAKLLGLDAEKLKASDEAMAVFTLVRMGVGRQVTLEDQGAGKVVRIGDRHWALPFALKQDPNGQWAFDTKAGIQEIVSRRVGSNEIATVQTMQDYVTAQHKYAEEDRDGDGIYEFAQKLISSQGAMDGLYWPAEPHNDSPASSLIETAAFGRAQAGEGFFGYRYRILTGQGSNVFGGEKSYISNGNMTGGFALIAWPVKYGVTGVKTFLINGGGMLYERDFGEETEARAAEIDEFNPDGSWTLIHE
ncbi:DUF2950 family protein [Rhizobium sp. BK251]|uniref:DUF2950 family protein n=1 Tax=Rhizobium sp. BK251 TaxID=2512125 RepID=UPI0010D8CB64|nr:DUF2950 family protein [Rhizobium sp. BK251]